MKSTWDAADLIFEQATRAAAEDVAALVNSAYRGESSKQGWTTEEALLGGQRTDAAMIREIIDRPGHLIWLCRDSKTREILGCVHLEHLPDRAYLGMLTVRPHLQNRQIGRRLMEFVENFARTEWRAPVMRMTVISLRHELIAYYERRGYARTGEVVEFPRLDTRFGVPKRFDFDLVVLEKNLTALC